jgi:hypothetical protein
MENLSGLANDKLPRELFAILRIFSADQELQRKALKHVDTERQEINWFAISQNDFGGGHMAAVIWAKALWTLENPPQSALFERALAMDDNLREAVIEGIAIAWGLG